MNKRNLRLKFYGSSLIVTIYDLNDVSHFQCEFNKKLKQWQFSIIGYTKHHQSLIDFLIGETDVNIVSVENLASHSKKVIFSLNEPALLMAL